MDKEFVHSRKIKADNKFSNNPVKCSIIIPVYKTTRGLHVTLGSISKILKSRNDVEIIVCNDGGGNEISRIVELHNFYEVRSKRNKGSYAARNKGIKNARGEYLFFLDADQKISKQWLDSGLNSLKNAEYVGGNIIVEPENKSNTWELLDAATAFPVQEYLHTFYFAPTANLFVSRHVFERVGLFDEHLRSGGDREFGVRVYKAGFKQGYNPEAVTFHPARNKADQLKKQKRIANGFAELNLLVWNKNLLIFLFTSIRHIFQIPFELSYNILRIFLDQRQKFKYKNMLFCILKKFLKTTFYWNVVLHTIKIQKKQRCKSRRASEPRRQG